jgi:hypothetical protein
MTTSRWRHESVFDVHPVTGESVEIFYADLTLESFGRCGAGWLLQRDRRSDHFRRARQLTKTRCENGDLMFARWRAPDAENHGKGINAVSTPEMNRYLREAKQKRFY